MFSSRVELTPFPSQLTLWAEQEHKLLQTSESISKTYICQKRIRKTKHATIYFSLIFNFNSKCLSLGRSLSDKRTRETNTSPSPFAEFRTVRLKVRAKFLSKGKREL